MTRIPCTVTILTRNSAATLERAIRSVWEFEEIILCDGGSLDKTHAIAASYGARIIPQDKSFLDHDGRIKNYGGVRNQTLAAASHQWFFFLDSDEYASPELVEEIRTAVAIDQPAAYWVPRTYVYQDILIERAVTYPNQQMRFFHRSIAGNFIKEVHERIELLPGAPVKNLVQYLRVPVEEGVEQMKEKWRRYLDVESLRAPNLTFWQWVCGAAHEAAVAALYILRFVRNLFLPGTRLPVRFELVRVWYQWMAITTSLGRVHRQ